MKKTFRLLTTLSLLALTALTVACSDSDGDGADVLSKGAGPLLKISLVDGGFVNTVDTDSLANNPMTRAIPDTVNSDDHIFRGTVFEMNDTVGIFAVNDQGEITISNAKYLYNGQQWTSSSPIEYDADCEYFAYFPYVPDASIPAVLAAGQTVTTGLDAGAFFTDLISGWDIKVDQKSYDNYKLSDLMVGKGVYDQQNRVMTFDVFHQNSLVILDVGYVRKVLRNGDYYWYEAATRTFAAADAASGNYVPSYVVGQFRCIVPTATPVTVKASDGQWTVNARVGSRGCYQTYAIGYDENNPTGGWSYHELEVGDIMYEDGSILHYNADNLDLIARQAVRAVGFVAFVSDGSSQAQEIIDDSQDTDGQPNSPYTHGLVHSFKRVGGWKMELPGDYTIAARLGKAYNSMGAAVGHYSGLQTTRAYQRIDETYYAAYQTHINDALPVMAAKLRPTGANTPNSGWFVPAFGQVAQCWYAMLEDYERRNNVDLTWRKQRIDNMTSITFLDERSQTGFYIHNRWNASEPEGNWLILNKYLPMGVNSVAAMYDTASGDSGHNGYATCTPTGNTGGKVTNYVGYGPDPINPYEYQQYYSLSSDAERAFWPLMAF